MTRQEKAEKITRLCNHNGCSAKIKKVHYDQFVDRQWHPHPLARWEKWVRNHPDFQSMTSRGTSEKEASTKMFNCACYYDPYCEAKETGLA